MVFSYLGDAWGSLSTWFSVTIHMHIKNTNLITVTFIFELCRTCTTVSWTFRCFYEKVMFQFVIILIGLLPSNSH